MPFTLVTWALLSGRFLYENYGFGLNISKWALKESQTRQIILKKKKKKKKTPCISQSRINTKIQQLL